jgi:hypothetical protein
MPLSTRERFVLRIEELVTRKTCGKLVMELKTAVAIVHREMFPSLSTETASAVLLDMFKEHKNSDKIYEKHNIR